MATKLIIAIPEAAPITRQFEQTSTVDLYVLNGQLEVPSSAEDMLIDCSGNGSGPFISLKNGVSYPTLPAGASKCVNGTFATLVEGAFSNEF